jgi:polyisoprenoid-binding protein YceI
MLVWLISPIGTLGLLTLVPASFRLEAEPNHSTIGFSVPIAGGMTRVTGKFTRFESVVIYDAEDPSKWSIAAAIEAASVDTGIDERDEDLRGPDFFDTENHPRILFESDEIERRGDELLARGTLTIRGVAREIELPFRVTAVDWEEEAPLLGLAAELSLNRIDFGVGTDWRHTLIPNFLGEEIQVQIFLWTKRGKRER